jgi:regulatory protein
MLRKIERSFFTHPEQDRQKCLEMLDNLIDRFQKSGLLNDNQYTNAMVSSLRRKGHSSRAIKARLMSKKVQSDIIDEAIQCYDQDNDENSEQIAAIHIAKKKKIGPFSRSRTIESEEKQKSLSFLARRGFSYETASHVLEMNLKEAEKIISKIR